MFCDYGKMIIEMLMIRVVVLLERTDPNNEKFLWVMSLNVHTCS